MKQLLITILLLCLSATGLGLILGPELVTNGVFDGNADGWVMTGDFIYLGGRVYLSYNDTGTVYQPISITAGKTYFFSVNISSATGVFTVKLGNGTASDLSTGLNSVTIVAGSGDATVLITGTTSDRIGTVDNVSVREVSANFNGDCIVNLVDYAIFANDWLAETPDIDDPNVDMNGDDVVDINDLLLFVDQWLDIEDDTTSPNKAIAPVPANPTANILLTQILSWDPNILCETPTYDVWFGESGSMSKVSSGQAGTSYDPALDVSTDYDWRIDTVTSQGTTTGDLWEFSTKANVKPDANDTDENIVTYLLAEIGLSATDTDGQDLTYYITSLPAVGHLRDTACYPHIITSVPYELDSDSLCFETVSDSNTSFNWKAYDGLEYGDPNTVTLNITAHPKDQLSMGKDGVITISDADLFDLTGNRGIALYLKTFASDCNILSKHESGVGGYDMLLVDGEVAVRLYDSGGLVDTVTMDGQINDGTWWNVGVAYDPNATDNKIYITAKTLADEYASLATGWISVSTEDYTNAEDLTLGNGYYWDMDNIRTYTFTAYDDPYYSWYGFITQNRTTAGNLNSAFGITINPASVVRFHCDYGGNNTISQIYDDNSNHYTGSLNSKRYIRYYPYFIAPCN